VPISVELTHLDGATAGRRYDMTDYFCADRVSPGLNKASNSIREIAALVRLNWDSSQRQFGGFLLMFIYWNLFGIWILEFGIFS
jgi:hypothetical protein